MASDLLHTRFTCEELELLLRAGAQLWGGLLEFDDINDATDPDMVDAWEKLFREYMQVLYKNVQEKNGWDPEADFPGATRIPR